MRILKKGGDIRDIPFKYSSHPEYNSCKYCSRKFAPSNIQRHQDICENLSRRPRPPPNVMSPQMSSYDGQTILKFEKRRELHRKYSYSRGSSPSSRMSRELEYESAKLLKPQSKVQPMSSTQFKRFIEEKRNSIYNSVKSTHWDSKEDGENEYPTIDSHRTQSYGSQPLTANAIQKLLMRKYSLADRHELVASVICQHCGRTFEKRASQRHIPICSKVQQTPKSKRVFYRGKWIQVQSSESLPAIQKSSKTREESIPNRQGKKRTIIRQEQLHKLNSIPESNNELGPTYLQTDSAKRQRATLNKKNRFASTQKTNQRLLSTVQKDRIKNKVKGDGNKGQTRPKCYQEKVNAKSKKNKYLESESQRTHMKIKHQLYHPSDSKSTEQFTDLHSGTRLVSYCTHCGAEFGREDNYCGLCGKRRILK